MPAHRAPQVRRPQPALPTLGAALLALTIAASLAACGDEPPSVAADAGRPADAAPVDAALTDAAVPDAATPDADITDAATPDANVPDADIPDADVPDADVPDADVPDADVPDADVPDADVPDAEVPDADITDADVPDAASMDASLVDADVPDAGTPDAGPPDAGPPIAIVYPAPPGERASGLYRVQLLGGPRPRESFVYASEARDVRTPGNPGTSYHTGRSQHWTTFESDAPVRVRVTSLAGPLGAVTVRPSRLGIVPEVRDADSVELVVPAGARVTVEPEAQTGACFEPSVRCVRAPLFLFADPPDAVSPLAGVPETDIYRPAPGDYTRDVSLLEGGDSWDGGVSGLPRRGRYEGHLPSAEGRRAVVFGPGVYHVGYWRLPASVEHVHLEGGAVVYGALHAEPSTPIARQDDYLTFWLLTLRPLLRVTGHGVLSGRDIPWHLTQDFGYCADDPCGWWRFIRLLRADAERVEVDDVTLVDSPYYVVDYTNGSDSRVRAHFDGIKILGQWAHNSDGLSLPPDSTLRHAFIQTNDDAVKLTGSNAIAEDVVFWHFANGATFQLGWYPRSFEGVRASHIDVVHSEWWWGAGDNSGLVSYPKISADQAGTIRGLSFDDVRMEGPVLRLVGLVTSARQTITGLTFRDIRVDAWGNDAYGSGRFNVLDAREGAIDDLVFERLEVGGVLIDDANYVREGRFGVEGPVTSLRFVP
jgi:hypothetical protein